METTIVPSSDGAGVVKDVPEPDGAGPIQVLMEIRASGIRHTAIVRVRHTETTEEIRR